MNSLTSTLSHTTWRHGLRCPIPCWQSNFSLRPWSPLQTLEAHLFGDNLRQEPDYNRMSHGLTLFFRELVRGSRLSLWKSIKSHHFCESFPLGRFSKSGPSIVCFVHFDFENMLRATGDSAPVAEERAYFSTKLRFSAFSSLHTTSEEEFLGLANTCTHMIHMIYWLN